MAKVIGREQLKRKFRAFPAAVRTEIRAALAKNADEMVSLAKQLVPVISHDLQNSITWREGGLGEEAHALGDYLVTVSAGNEKAYYARWVEYGVAAQTKGARITNAKGRSRKSGRTTKGQDARPFFYPAYRTLKKRMQSRISRGVNKAVKQIAGKA